MGDQLVAVLQKIDTVIPEQVIAVPKISYDGTPQRVVDRRRPPESGTVGGSAYDRVLFLVAAACGADR